MKIAMTHCPDGGSKDLWNVENLYQNGRHYKAEDSHLRTHRHENLKSYLHKYVFSGQKLNWTAHVIH
jgi:hypothetical protein